jgi:Protein of unknown function (DUF1559)
MSTLDDDPDPIEKPRMNIWLVAMFLGVVVLLWVVRPTIDSGNTKIARRSEALSKLQKIGLATQNYASEHDGVLPPAALVVHAGMENFGWSVSLLPFLEQTNLYEQLDLEKAWNDPANREPASVKLRIFLNPRVKGPTEESGYSLLHYAANSQVFRPGKPWSIDEISVKDGSTNTIFYGEIGNHFRPWAAPGSLRDPAAGLGDGPNQFGIKEGDGLVCFAFGDGSARPISRDIDPKILKAMATPDGGEVVPQDW